MADDSIPIIAFDNQLTYDVIVYDSFDDDDDDGSISGTNGQPSSQAYFATLTQLGKVPAGTTVNLQPIHDSSAFVVESATDNKPLKRMVALSFEEITSLSILKDDEAAMAQTFQFVSFFLNNPNDAISVAFNKVLNDTTDDLATSMDTFFQSQPAYAKCCFEDYMMALAYTALHPSVPDPSQPQGTYSLKIISDLMGSKWSDLLSDIFVTKFTCFTKDSKLVLTFEVDISMLPFESAEIAANVLAMLNGTKVVKAQILFNYAISLNIFGTRLSILLDALTIPIGDTKTLSITKPGISIDINPLFKFVVFTMEATFPFNINGKTFDALASFAIDNEEAAIGVDIKGDKTSLPAPPGIKGLHFDEFGVGMGLFFTPPGFAVGIEGKFHIGDSASGNVISLDDDSFALVCEFVADAVEPKYAAFSVPQLNLNQVIELFTNVNPKIDVPVNFSDLSFHWSDGLMDAVVLPDGTLSNGGYGFSAAVNIFSFGFFGEMNLDLNSGLTANVEVSPISWGNIFKLTGDGKGYSMKYDQNGNPIKNNFVPTTVAEKDAVAKATNKQIVTPGGACLIINTLSMPILHLNAQASLFDLLNYDITADINKDGIKFELDYGAILTEKMVCNLTDFHNLYGEFGYYIDKSITIPTINGINLGTIPLKAAANLHLSVNTSTTNITISTGGNFDFEGYHFTFGDFSADINISKISDFVGAIVKYIGDNAKAVFNQLLDTAEHWAAAAAKGIVTGFDDAGKVLNTIFHKTKEEGAAILKAAGFAANVIANALKNGYNATQKDIAVVMKALGYTADDVIASLRNAFNATSDSVADALKSAGYAINDVANAIKKSWNCAQNDVAWAMMMVGYTETDVANGLRDAFNATSDSVADAMKKVGYKAEDVAKAIKNAWNCAQKDVAWAMMMVGFTETDVANGLRNAFNATTDSVADAMKQIGYKAEDVAKAIKNAWNCAQKDVAWAMMIVGFTETDVANGLRNAFNATTDSVADAMKQIGYKAQDVAKAIKNAWNCAVQDVAWAMMIVGFTADDICAGLQSAFNAAAQDVANAFKAIGILAQDTANAIKTVYNLAINDAASVLKQAGYAANDVASALKNAFNTSVDAVADAMKQVGYAANDVKNAFDELGGDFKSFADTAWDDTKHYLNPSNW